tara:strand:- start:53 stop:379 length:327 start_codon:yes stop_codon:yes gene_type:complete
MEAIVIKPNEKNVEVIERDTPFELEELQELVGGLIEVVPDKIDLRNINGYETESSALGYMGVWKLMVVNEEGLILGLPYNEKATNLLTHFNPYGIRGTAVLMDEGLLE